MSKEVMQQALEAMRDIYNTACQPGLANIPRILRIAFEATGQLSAALAAPQPAQEPIGFMNAGHVHEMQQGRLPYGYVYPKSEAGASVAIYTTPQPQRQPLTDEQAAAVVGNVANVGDGIRILRATEQAHGITKDKE